MTHNIQNSGARISFSHAMQEVYDHYSPAGRLQTEVKAQAQVFCDPNASSTQLEDSLSFFTAYAENGSYKSPSGTVTDFSDSEVQSYLATIKPELDLICSSTTLSICTDDESGRTVALNNPSNTTATLKDIKDDLDNQQQFSTETTSSVAYTKGMWDVYSQDPNLTEIGDAGAFGYNPLDQVQFKGSAQAFAKYLIPTRASVPADPFN